MNYVLSSTIQLEIYETYMDLKKKKQSKQDFKYNENRYVVEAALIGGFLSGILMNSFECVMYLRMADQDSNNSLVEIYRDQGSKLFTKGLGTRIVMTQGYSLMYFNLLFYLGKIFNCDLLEDADE